MKIVIPCINFDRQFYSKYTNWSKVDYYYVNEHIAGIYKDHLDWSKVLYYLLNNEFLIDHVKYIPFFDSKIYQSFTLTQFSLFKEYIDWTIISYYGVSEEFLEDFKDYIDWSKVEYDDVSEDFLREFKDYVDWDLLSRYGIHKEDILNNNNYIYPITKHNDVCGICIDNEGTMYQLPCKHVFHRECLKLWIKKTKTCPMCRHKL